AIVLETPKIVIVDGRQGSGAADDIVELGVMGIPPVIVVLDIQLEFIAGCVVDLGADQVLVALVVGDGRQFRLRKIQIRIGMFIGRGEGAGIREIVGVLGAKGGDFVEAAPIGAAGLELIV